MKRTDEPELRGRVKDLTAALDLAGERLEPELRARVQRVLAGADERLALGVDHTVVALIGGTGSGKSSLFNAISRLKFADVGAKRPTTSALTACSWSADSGRLLSWLGVDEERSINRISELDAADEDELDGLILLDLPDYDSVATEHRDLVDHVLPLVDLLLWVVDPQKYADDALHTGYLKQMAGAQGSMLVVLNQIDTVPPGQRDVLAQDVRRLLAEDGLAGVDVLAASALEGEGITEVRRRLAEIVAKRSVAAARVADEVSTAAREVAASLPGEAPRRVDKHIDAAVTGLSELIGLDALADSAAAGGSATPGELRGTTVEPVHAGWISGTAQHLAPRWRKQLTNSLAGPAALASHLNTAFASMGNRGGSARRTTPASIWFWGALALAAVLGITAAVTDQFHGTRAVIWISALLLVLIVGAALTLTTRRRRAATARTRRERFLSDAHERMTDVVREQLANPTLRLLEDHAEARTLALAAIENMGTEDRLTTVRENEELSTK